MLMEALLAGDSVKKAASRVGAGNEAVTQFLLDAGAACRAFHDRTITGLSLDTVLCQRVWGFSYVRRRNAYTPEINRGIPREGWVWTARDPETGLVVDWSVGSGDAAAAAIFVADTRRRLTGPMALKARGRDILLERGQPYPGEAAVFTRLFGTEAADEQEDKAQMMAMAADFRRRCLNLELALSLHLTSHNVLGDAGRQPPAVRLGLVDDAWSLATLATFADKT